METLQSFFETGIYTFLLTFVRIGTALILFPGIGDTYTPARIRLFMSLGLSIVLFPATLVYMPEQIPGTFAFFMLILGEFMIGAFIGTIVRILMLALDTAGMVISLQAGLSSAQLFNPAFSSQGSIFGAFLVICGMALLFTTNLHHLLIYGLIGSYDLFPVGGNPDLASMSQLVTQAVSSAFYTGIRIAAPFMIITTILYIIMGILARLMPQVQVFLLAIPVQIMLAFLVMSVAIASGLFFWLSFFESSALFFLSPN